MMRVVVETGPAFRTDAPEVLFGGSYFRWGSRSYDIHPDGQLFLMLQEVSDGQESSTSTKLA